MRKVINVSMPSTMVRDVQKAVKEGNYMSTSEFFRDLVRDWQEERLLAELEQSEAEIKAGKGKKLRSLRDLRGN